MIDIGHKLIEASTFIAHGKWLPSLRAHREAASSFDTINDALCRTADAARCWEVNPSIYNDRRLTQLVERAQDAFAQAYPATDTTLRLLQQMTPDGLQLALIRCEDSGSPLIAISIDADRWRQAARLDAPPAVVAGRLSGNTPRAFSHARTREGELSTAPAIRSVEVFSWISFRTGGDPMAASKRCLSSAWAELSRGLGMGPE